MYRAILCISKRQLKRGSGDFTSVDSGVSLLLMLLSSTLSAGVASPETPFWSISMGSTIAE
jgi:hypothetical protein